VVRKLFINRLVHRFLAPLGIELQMKLVYEVFLALDQALVVADRPPDSET